MASRGQFTSFDDVMRRCATTGSHILVEFKGGIDELVATPLEKVRPMPIRWRDRGGDAEDGDWVRGDRFRQVINAKRTGVAGAPATGRNDDLKNYFDKAGSLAEMLRICEREGASVLVGFEGGRGALRRAKRPALLARQFYKWDWVDRPTGIKDHSNWIPGDAFAAIVGRLDS
jgi:hypothetical protein